LKEEEEEEEEEEKKKKKKKLVVYTIVSFLFSTLMPDFVEIRHKHFLL